MSRAIFRAGMICAVVAGMGVTAPLATAQTASAQITDAQTTGQVTAAMPARCYLLGQIAASHWLDMLATLGSNGTAQIDPALARVEGATTLYQTLGCDMVALTGAMECVLVSDTATSPKGRARQCLIDAGLSRDN